MSSWLSLFLSLPPLVLLTTLGCCTQLPSFAWGCTVSLSLPYPPLGLVLPEIFCSPSACPLFFHTGPCLQLLQDSPRFCPGSRWPHSVQAATFPRGHPFLFHLSRHHLPIPVPTPGFHVRDFGLLMLPPFFLSYLSVTEFCRSHLREVFFCPRFLRSSSSLFCLHGALGVSVIPLHSASSWNPSPEDKPRLIPGFQSARWMEAVLT